LILDVSNWRCSGSMLQVVTELELTQPDNNSPLRRAAGTFTGLLKLKLSSFHFSFYDDNDRFRHPIDMNSLRSFELESCTMSQLWRVLPTIHAPSLEHLSIEHIRKVSVGDLLFQVSTCVIRSCIRPIWKPRRHSYAVSRP